MTDGATAGALDFFVAGTPDLLCIKDIHGYFHYLNPAWQQTLGYDLEYLRAHHHAEFMHPEDVEAPTDRIDHARRTQRFRNRYVHEDGRIVWLDWASIFDPDAGITYAMARDITEQVEAEERRLRLHQQITHEMAAPLGAIRLFIDAKRDSNEVTPEIHRFIDRNVDRLMRFMSDARDVGLIHSGRLEISLAPIDLSEVARRAASDLGPAAERLGVTIELQTESAVVKGDANRLGQVATNLIHNAIKFSPPGGCVRVQCQTQGAFAVVRVMDEGPGIKDQEVHKLFRPFVQLDNAHLSNEEGSGLGLYISKELVEAHGGTIGVEESSRGVCFTFQVPQA